ncbi:MAG: dienelactone hydrolase family protein [Acidobacteriota bacterium]|nr:dienelactone hydrolase family protein [Acidobacteriota bacterium]
MATIEDVTIPLDKGLEMRAFLACPEEPRSQPRPAIIVIHELLGLNDDIRRLTARAADLGYVALAPNLYERPGPKLWCVVRTLTALRRGEGRAFADLEAARRWLGARPEVDAARMGVIGFCMGGGFALLLAARAPLGAAAVFYGDVPKSSERLAGVCPVIAGYGGRDRIFALQGRRLEKLLSDLDVVRDIRIYESAGHSYMNRHTGLIARLGAIGPMKVGYNPEAAEDSWRRIGAFFAEHLGEVSRPSSD